MSTTRYFHLGSHVEERDGKVIAKTTSGLIKVLHLGGECAKQKVEEYLSFEIELRRGVKAQLRCMEGVGYFASVRVATTPLGRSCDRTSPVTPTPSSKARGCDAARWLDSSQVTSRCSTSASGSRTGKVGPGQTPHTRLSAPKLPAGSHENLEVGAD
jgi:hypothetical protein